MTTESTQALSAVEIEWRLRTELPCWHYADGWLQRTYRTGDWNATLLAVNTIGQLADAAWHHPELAVSYGMVEVRLQTYDAGGVTMRDFNLAREMDATMLREAEVDHPTPMPGMTTDDTQIANPMHG